MRLLPAWQTSPVSGGHLGEPDRDLRPPAVVAAAHHPDACHRWRDLRAGPQRQGRRRVPRQGPADRDDGPADRLAGGPICPAGGTMRHEPIAPLGAGALLLVVVAGAGALFATYWDDAWHTDLRRDAATIPPHLLLYGSVAVVGLVVAAWGLSTLRRSRSLPEALRQPPLLLG